MLTRKRWALYFIPMIVLVTIVVLPITVLSGNYRLILAPLLLIAVWLMMRQLTPTGGYKERTIQGTPGMPILMGWIMSCLVAGIFLLWWDFLVLGHPFSTDLTPSQVVWGSVLIVTMIGGVALLDRRYNFNRRKRDQTG